MRRVAVRSRRRSCVPGGIGRTTQRRRRPPCLARRVLHTQRRSPVRTGGRCRGQCARRLRDGHWGWRGGRRRRSPCPRAQPCRRSLAGSACPPLRTGNRARAAPSLCARPSSGRADGAHPTTGRPARRCHGSRQDERSSHNGGPAAGEGPELTGPELFEHGDAGHRARAGPSLCGCPSNARAEGAHPNTGRPAQRRHG